MSSIIGKDTDLKLPRIVLVEASAGSGKTRALTLRLAQYLVSRAIPNNRLRNILAVTFTNNAALEMKQRVLRLLKQAALGAENDEVSDLRSAVGLPAHELRKRAGAVVGEILDQYSDFQIQTIDSFLARVFKASALEFGFSPGFQVVLDSRPILDEAFSLMAGEVVKGSESEETLNELANRLRELKSSRGKFQWNPYRNLSTEVKRLYSRIVSTARPLSDTDHSAEYRSKGARLCELVEKLGAALDLSPLQPSSRFVKYREEAKARRIDRLIELQFPDSPAVKGKSPQIEFRKFTEAMSSLCEEIAALRGELVVLHAREYFQPYIRTHRLLQGAIDEVRRRRGEVDLGDLILKLARFIETGNVPDLYVSLGERIYHYLIDEFQDTAPIQWNTLYPLIDNSLSEGGSFFAVGDIKQSIYGFRGADWRIMKTLSEQRAFASAPTEVIPLSVNYRSGGRILDFVRTVFHQNVPLRVLDGAERVSGLSTFRQEPRSGAKDKGYVSAKVITGDTDERPEREEILAVVAQCLARGYARRNIAILTPENEDVVKVSGWLNEAGHEFIPFSTLDIRTRKVVGEVLMILRFLDSPLDDLAFAAFLLGDIAGTRIDRDGPPRGRETIRAFVFEHHRTAVRRPLYAMFRERFPDLWNRYFDQLFGLTGYLPLYDLITHVYKSFDVFGLVPAEEAALVKLLEVIAQFEEQGRNSLKEFIGFADEISEDSDWNLDVPPDVNAIRVMTVHKAKGLGFPVVIVLLYDVPMRGDGIYLEETKETVRLVRLVKKDKTKEESPLSPLFADRELKTRVDQLNKLYVAFTRASGEMYVLGVNYGKGDEPSAFIPAGEYGKPAAKASRSDDKREERTVSLSYGARARVEQTEGSEGIHPEETRRGELVHNILARLEFVDGLDANYLNTCVEEEARKSGDLSRIPEMQKLLETFLRSPGISPLFQTSPDRKILNEREFVRSDGQLFRVDRVVVDPSAVTVIDYKTGAERGEYAHQVRNYMAIVRDAFPGKEIRGALAYVDLAILWPVPEGNK